MSTSVPKDAVQANLGVSCAPRPLLCPGTARPSLWPALWRAARASLLARTHRAPPDGARFRRKDDEMTEEEAIEYIDYNVVNAFVGDNTPIFVNVLEDEKENPI